jgi:hypothetical protein
LDANYNDKVKDNMGRTCSTNVKRSAYRILVGKQEGKRPLGRRRWVDNIKIVYRDRIRWYGQY